MHYNDDLFVQYIISVLKYRNNAHAAYQTQKNYSVQYCFAYSSLDAGYNFNVFIGYLYKIMSASS